MIHTEETEPTKTPMGTVTFVGFGPGDPGLITWAGSREVTGADLLVVDSPTMVWLFYLAVNDSIRSRGYGSRILSSVRWHAAGRTVVLELEPLDDGAPNLEQRRRRRHSAVLLR